MDLDDFRSIILDSGLDVWSWIDMAISVASAHHSKELKNRRDGIVQKLYAATKCTNCESDGNGEVQIDRKREVDCDDIARSEHYGQKKEVIEIKNLLDCQNLQAEERLIELLKKLVEMNITFIVLKETDIGRHVTRFRKHSSEEVRMLVKILVRKWKDTVDEWVRLSTPEEEEDEEVNKLNGGRKNSIQNDSTVILVREEKNAPVFHCLNPPKEIGMKDKQNESKNLIFSATKCFPRGNQETPVAKRHRNGETTDDCNNIPKTKKTSSNGYGSPSGLIL